MGRWGHGDPEIQTAEKFKGHCTVTEQTWTVLCYVSFVLKALLSTLTRAQECSCKIMTKTPVKEIYKFRANHNNFGETFPVTQLENLKNLSNFFPEFLIWSR